MTQALPKILPINELKNTSQIAKTCKESDVPIIITKNGYGEMVLMSIELYEQTIAKMQSALLINEAVEEANNGAVPVDGKDFFKSMREKYGR